MNRRQLESKIRRAFSAAAPNDLEAVLRRCEQQKGDLIMMPQPRKKTNLSRRLAAVAAAFVLLLGAGTFLRSGTVATAVSLDVNPSIRIDLNRRQKVLEVVPLNDDGSTVVGTMDFSGASLEVTVNALIGSMLRQGYLSDMANSILISVEDSDPQRASQLQQQLSNDIASLLQTEDFSGAVLSQNFTSDETLSALAEQYGITPGKAQLVRQMASQNAFYAEEELAQLPINDLYLLNPTVENVDHRGAASDKAYIGREAALQAALAHAGVALPDRWEAELDYDDGKMIYDVEFTADGGEYDYEIDAMSGAVYKSETDRVRDEAPDAAPQPAADTLLSPEEAFLKALVHANLAQYSVNFGMEWELDTHRGVQVYELEFRHDGTEYDYEIDARTGDVLKYSKERENEPSVEVTATAPSHRAEDAKKAVLAHAGLSESDIQDYECELDDGLVYEISFHSGGYEYEYEVAAASGNILKHEKERDD